MSKKHSTEISLPETDLTVKVVFFYYAGMPGKMYLRNGDPGYPAEPPVVELDEVIVAGEDIMPALSKPVLDRIEEMLLETNWEAE